MVCVCVCVVWAWVAWVWYGREWYGCGCAVSGESGVSEWQGALMCMGNADADGGVGRGRGGRGLGWAGGRTVDELQLVKVTAANQPPSMVWVCASCCCRCPPIGVSGCISHSICHSTQAIRPNRCDNRPLWGDVDRPLGAVAGAGGAGGMVAEDSAPGRVAGRVPARLRLVGGGVGVGGVRGARWVGVQQPGPVLHSPPAVGTAGRPPRPRAHLAHRGRHA